MTARLFYATIAAFIVGGVAGVLVATVALYAAAEATS